MPVGRTSYLPSDSWDRANSMAFDNLLDDGQSTLRFLSALQPGLKQLRGIGSEDQPEDYQTPPLRSSRLMPMGGDSTDLLPIPQLAPSEPEVIQAPSGSSSDIPPPAPAAPASSSVGAGAPGTAPGTPPAIAGRNPAVQARIYQQARASGRSDEDARILTAISETEGGTEGQPGDNGQAHGIYQFHDKGQMPDFRAWVRRNNIPGDPNQLAVDPEIATRYAAEGYLGQAIDRGRALGYSGADLATYVQRTGQRSVDPGKTGANYTRLFGQSAAPSPGPATSATVSPTQAASESRAQSGETRTGAIDAAGITAQYKGQPYVFGGAGGRSTFTPGTATDCSGFVASVWKNTYGLDLAAHTDGSYNQLRQLGAPEVSQADARPGDIVYYMGAGTGGAIAHHMGIYSGNGKVLDMSVSGGSGVRERDIGHAGQFVILRDPRINAEAPRTAQAPPPIVPSADSGGTRVSRADADALIQDAGAATPPAPAAAPVAASPPAAAGAAPFAYKALSGEPEPMPEDASTINPIVGEPGVRNVVPWDASTGQTTDTSQRDLGAFHADDIQYRQPLGSPPPERDRWATDPEQTPSSYNDPTTTGTQTTPLPTPTVSLPYDPRAADQGAHELPTTTYNDPTTTGTQTTPLPTPVAPAPSPLKPLYDLGGQIIGYVHAGAEAVAGAAQGAADQAYQALEPARRAAASLDNPPGYDQPIYPGEPFDPNAQQGSVIRALQTPIMAPPRSDNPNDRTPEDIRQLPYQAAEAGRQSVVEAAQTFADAIRAGQEGRPLAAAGTALWGAIQTAGLPWTEAARTINAALPEMNIAGVGPGDVAVSMDLVRDGINGVNRLRGLLTPENMAAIADAPGRVAGAVRGGAEAVVEGGRALGARIGEGRRTARELNAADPGGPAALGTLGVAPAAPPGPTENAPTFYSQLRRTIEEKMPNRAAPQQVQAVVRGNGVKPDEVMWTGLDDFLSSQKGPVTKQQVLDFLDQNEVRVEEVVKGGGVDRSVVHDTEQALLAGVGNRGWNPAEADRLRLAVQREGPSAYTGTDPDIRALVQEYADAQASAAATPPTKYGQYTMPGGENYRELLLTRPQQPAEHVTAQLEVRPSQTAGGQWDIVNATDGRVVRPGFADRAEAAQELAFRQQQPSVAHDVANYASPHWDEPNVLAHVRFNERTAPDGKRVLNIEEIQSDWHQAGRKQGYDSPEIRARVEAENQAARVKINELERERGRLATESLTALQAERIGRGDQTPRLREIDVRRQEISSEIARLHDGMAEARMDGAPPDAPFQKTWPELAMKRMIRWASENDFDRITWPPGSVHAERYSLAQHVDELFYTTKDGATGTLIGQKGGREVVAHDNVPANKLGDYVGQAVADRMLSMEPDITAHGDQYYLTGHNLAEMGGLGMKGFYDQILPAVAAKLGKKFGARVTELPMEIPGSWPRGQALQVGRTQTMHSLDITPAMKQSVLEQGQPLFAAAGTLPPSAPTDRLGVVNRVLGQGAASSVSGGVGAAVNQQLNPDDPNAGLKGFVAGALAPPLIARGGRALARRAGAAPAGAEGALGTLGNAPEGGAGLGRLGELFPDAASWYRRAKARNVSEMAASNITPPSKAELVRGTVGTVGYGSMLGPGTAAFNVAASLMQPIWSIPKEPARAIGRAIETGNPAALREPAAMMGGVLTGFGHVGEALWDVIRARGKYAPPPDAPPLSQRIADPIGRGLMQALEMPGRAWAGGPDAIFGTLAQYAVEGRRAAQLATDAGHRGQRWQDWADLYRNEVERVRSTGAPPHQIGAGTADVIAAGEEAALRAAYRQPLGDIGKKVRQVARLGDFPVFGNFVAPFFNSPWNIHLQGLERSPAGLVMNTQPSKFDKYYDAAVGTAAVLGLAELVRDGVVDLSGSGPSDANERQAWIDDGNRPYSMKVGGVSIPTRAFASAETLLNATGETLDFLRYQKKGADSRALSGDALGRIGKLIKQAPYAAGYATIADTVQYGLPAAAADLATRATPGASTLRAIGTAVDPNERAVDSGAGVPMADEARQRWQLATGQRGTLPVAQNILGEPKENTQQGPGAFFGRFGFEKDDPVIGILRASRTFPPDPRREITLDPEDGVKITLLPSERRLWDAERGKVIRQAGTKLAGNPRWASMSEAAKQDVLHEIFNDAADVADARVLQAMGRTEITRRVKASAPAPTAGR